MISKRKTLIIMALFVISIFLFQNCATIIRGTTQIIRGTTQNIPVTSNPSGAKIIVGKKEVGYAPIMLTLKRKRRYVIRIEKEGYVPLEIRIIPIYSTNGMIASAGNVVLGITAGVLLTAPLGKLIIKDWGFNFSATFWGAVCIGTLVSCLAYFVAKDIDSKSKLDANSVLSPKELNVTLTKIEGNAQPDFILIDAEQFQNIKWIRIKCIDNDKEEIVNID